MKINATCISLQGFFASHTKENINENQYILICGSDLKKELILKEFEKYDLEFNKLHDRIYNCELIVDSLKQK